MKIFVYFLSIILVLSSANVYALLPIGIAVAGAVSGEIAVGTGKAVIKKMSNETKKDLVKSATAICAKNPALASFCSGVVGAVVGSGLEVEVNNVDNNNDIDINVYQKNKDICSKTTIFYDRFDQNYRRENAHRYKTDKSEVFFEYFSQNYKSNKNATYSYSNLRFEPSETTIFELLKKNSYTQVKSHFTITTQSYTGKVDVNDKAQLFFYAFKLDENHACFSKSRVSDDDLVNIFNNLSDDDITNIYNYDYSQYNNITVNNSTMIGNKINESKNNFDKNYTNKELSENATTKMKNKDKDYTIDKINDSNCTKNEKNEYDKCGADRDDDKKDDTDDKKDDNVASNTASTPSDTEFPNFCNWAKFICDDTTKDTKVDIADDLPETADTEIVFVGTCPADVVISGNLFGNVIEWKLMDWTKYCSILSTYIKPIVIAVSSYSAVLILAGRNESN